MYVCVFNLFNLDRVFEIGLNICKSINLKRYFII